MLLACVLAGSPYQNYQMRIAYATYKLVLGMPGGERHVGFTRILHTGAADDLMAEIPTIVARPLDGANRDDGYVVLNRPWAVVRPAAAGAEGAADGAAGG